MGIGALASAQAYRSKLPVHAGTQIPGPYGLITKDSQPFAPSRTTYAAGAWWVTAKVVGACFFWVASPNGALVFRR